MASSKEKDRRQPRWGSTLKKILRGILDLRDREKPLELQHCNKHQRMWGRELARFPRRTWGQDSEKLVSLCQQERSFSGQRERNGDS